MGGVFADYWSARPPGIQATFVGRSSCVDCHRAEAEAYQGSHHDLAMDLATAETVLGDFNDVTFEHDGIVSRMYRDGDRFMIHTEGEDGEMHDFHVQYVFGVEPLQQYMVEFDRTPDMPLDQIARVQVLRISWDTKAKRWFYLRPPDVGEKLAPERSAPLDRDCPALADDVRGLSFDQPETQLRPANQSVSHHLLRDRREL